MADDFVKNKLMEWGLNKWIKKFKDEGINKECLLYDLDDENIEKLITQTGPRLKFKRELASLKADANTMKEPSVSVNIPEMMDVGASAGSHIQSFSKHGDTECFLLPSMILSNVRSLSRKHKELVNLVHSKKVYADCWVMCFTETWLNSRTPNSALQLEGFKMLRADRTEDSLKQCGGGLCFYVNQSLCTDIQEVSKSCSPELETLTITFSPRETGHTLFVLIAVYIPPDAARKDASQQLASHIMKMEETHPGSVVLALGDFNHVKLNRVLVKYSPQISVPTRKSETLDQCYCTKSVAFYTDMDIPLGDSDHNVVYLTPKNKRLTSRE